MSIVTAGLRMKAYKRHVAWYYVPLVLPLSAATAVIVPSHAQSEQPGLRSAHSQAVDVVRGVERQWLDAYEKRDLEMMNAVLADDFVITYPSGKTMAKADMLASLRNMMGRKPSTRFWTEGVSASVYGDTVVLRGLLVTEMISPAGEPSKRVNRYTDTYIKRSGRWQVATSHLSHAPPLQPSTRT